jgi:hypothetical protein
MAKRKHSRKKAAPEPREISPFWLLTGGILLFVIALFILLGAFSTGGPLPKALFDGSYWTFGWAAYFLPVALVYWGVYKFNAENHRLPLGRLIGLLGVLVFMSCGVFTAFDHDMAYIAADRIGAGGATGELIGRAVLTALDPLPASLMFLVFTVLSAFFAFGISPIVLKNLVKLFTRTSSEDADLHQLRDKAEASGFKLNEGVPVEHSRDKLRLGSMKNTAEKLSRITRRLPWRVTRTGNFLALIY